MSDSQEGQSRPSLYGEADPAPASGTGPTAPGLADQFTGVLTEPVALFQRLNETPAWGMAMALLVLLGVGLAVVWGMRVDVDAMLRPVLEANPRVDAAQIDSIIEMQSKFILPFSILGALIGIPVVLLISGLINWGLGVAFREGERPTFHHGMSAAAVPGLVMALKQALVLAMCLLRPVGGAKPDQLSPTSLGFYVHQADPRLQALLFKVDLFDIAGLVLAFLAVRHLLKARPVAAWLVVAISLGFQAIGVLTAR